ncbi:MAG TPA: helix-turn-helix domain-containing protein [Phycisphaerae bacterium]|nr:helix-turn-helix domain-containing protein [Phycisphaerae bacterium]
MDVETTPAVAPLLLSAFRAAKALDISERKLWELTDPRGPIPCVRIGRRVLYDPRDLQAYIDQQKGQQTLSADRSLPLDSTQRTADRPG